MDQAKTSIDRWMAEFPASACTVFVEPSTKTLNPKVNTAAQQIIDYLKSLTDTRIRLYDWPQAIQDLYNSDPSHPYPFVDGVHPTQPGQDMLAAGIRTTVDTCP